MRRPFVISTGALALALLPALLSAQTPPAQQPPAGQPPAGQQPPAAAEPAKTEAPKVPFTSPSGILLVQIKPDQTATFEEMIGKLKAGLGKTEDATAKQQAAGFKVYKAAEPFGKNSLYVIFIEPTVPNADYELFAMLQKVMTKEELSAPTTAEMWKKYVDAFGAGLSKLSLTPVGGM
jgi:hypothetical protein